MTQSTADTLDSSLLEIQGSIEQAESMLKQLETQGQGDSPTAEKIRNLLDQMRAQRKKLFDSLTTEKVKKITKNFRWKHVFLKFF